MKKMNYLMLVASIFALAPNCVFANPEDVKSDATTTTQTDGGDAAGVLNQTGTATSDAAKGDEASPSWLDSLRGSSSVRCGACALAATLVFFGLYKNVKCVREATDKGIEKAQNFAKDLRDGKNGARFKAGAVTAGLLGAYALYHNAGKLYDKGSFLLGS